MNEALAFVFGYLLGSIPFGLVITLAAGGPDVRTIGSGNIGATNVLRTGRKGLAALTLVCDALKGTAAVVVAHRYLGLEASLIAGFGAFIGHLFPVWLTFKGGKGVATYIGVLIGVYWPGALIFCGIWLVVAFVSRYSSLSALIASALTPAALYRAAIRAIDERVANQGGAESFAKLAGADQDAFLKTLEAGKAELGGGVEAKTFFELLLQNTMEGFWSDPIYGGNRDMAGWKLVGFPGARYDHRPYVTRHGERYPLPPVGLKGRPDWTRS